jgi:hemolysin activation/secretion protein
MAQYVWFGYFTSRSMTGMSFPAMLPLRALLFVILLFLGTFSLALAGQEVKSGDAGLYTVNETPGVTGQPEGDRKFFVKKIVIQGNTLYSPAELSPLIRSWENREVSLGELKQAGSRLQDFYRKKGYFLMRAYVPTQTVENGTVALKVIEGKIGDVRVEGNKHYSTDLIKWLFSSSMQKGVLKEDKLQRSLLLMNEYEDLEVKAFIERGKAEDLTDITLKVKDENPVYMGIEYNNFGNPYIGDNRTGLHFSFGDLTGWADSLYLRGIAQFNSTSNTPFFQAGYTRPINRNSTKATIYYANSDVIMGRDLSILEIRGAAQLYGFLVSQPLQRSLSEKTNFTFGFGSKSVKNYYFTSIPTTRDEVRAVSLGYTGDWTSSSSRNFLNLTASQGLGQAFGGMTNDDPLASRYLADNTFTKLNLDLLRIQKMGGRSFLVLRGSGQYSTEPLVVSEQFPLGGPDSVRGYQQSEFLGDSGYALSAEYRFPLQKTKTSFQGALFIDYGTVNLRLPQPGEVGTQSLSGYGAGLRWSLDKDTWARVDWGWPISPPKNVLNRQPVFYGQVVTRFHIK